MRVGLLFLPRPIIFHRFGRWRGTVKPGFAADFVGQMTDQGFVDPTFAVGVTVDSRQHDRTTVPPYPQINEELFEWIALLSAILEAKGSFTMIEGGAGYGRWSVAAAQAIRRKRPDLPYYLTGVEAEPTHFEWMAEHFRNNAIDPASHRLLFGAIDAEDGEAIFAYDDNPAGWYGQAIIPTEDYGGTHTRTRKVPTFSVAALLADSALVDYLDFDIQGAEAAAVPAGIEIMSRKVRRAFIATHSAEADRILTETFSRYGWKCVHRFACGARERTRYGVVEFGDGVQHWINPNCRPSRGRRRSPGAIHGMQEANEIRPDARFRVFLESAALRINHARLNHLAGLGLDLDGKRVLEVGAGIGLHTGFFEQRGCTILSTDGNAGNVAEMLRRHPEREIGLIDLDQDLDLSGLGEFDIVYCYGTLYHLRNPDHALARLAAICRGQILIETIVSRGHRAELHLISEPGIPNQALSGIGCRPTRLWVMAALRRHFGHAYATWTQPDHPDFATDWTLITHDGNLRAVFIGSKQALALPALADALPPRHRNAPAPPRQPRPQRVWIDVGAHHGEHSRKAAEEDPGLVVHAFEPLPMLHRAFATAPPNFHAHAVAVAETDGIVPFHINRFDAASSMLPLDSTAQACWIDGDLLHEQRVIQVPATRLDSFLARNEIAKVEFLKIDAQGADLAVVRSAGQRLADIDRIQLEVAVTPRQLYIGAADRDTIVGFLAEHRFRLISAERQSHGQEENLTFVRERTAANGCGAMIEDATEPEEVGGIFDFTSALTAHGTVQLAEQVLALVTSPQQWAYTAIVPIGTDHSEDTARYRVSIEVLTQRGAVQFGILNREETDFLCTATVGVGQGWQPVTLVSPPLDRAGPLVIRNAFADGASEAQCRLRSVQREPDAVEAPQDHMANPVEIAFLTDQLHASAEALVSATTADPDSAIGAALAVREATALLRRLLARGGVALVNVQAHVLAPIFASLDEATLSAVIAATTVLRPLRPVPRWRFGNFLESGDLTTFIRYAVWQAVGTRPLSSPIRFAWHVETALALRLDNDLGLALYVGGCFEPNEFAVLEQILRPGMTVIDGGANEGAYSVYLAARAGTSGRVLAVEPSQRELARLRANVALNNFRQIEVIPAALAETPGQLELLVAEDAHAGHNTLGELGYPGVGSHGRVTVEAVTLDALAASRKLETVDVIKLDLEGAELRALCGASDILRKFRPMLILEASDRALRHQGGSVKDVTGLLSAAGYRLMHFDDATGMPAPLDDSQQIDTVIAVHGTRPFGL
ncbi:MAG TPA: FkbM family methyltransferase [Acetobacteraceae bacterium]|nr:FkbM family methyltransferase [Acetobacteraceae bacterium]